MPLATYGYDGNGNRVSYNGIFGSLSGSYDSQDRIQSYGDLTFKHNAAGELIDKIRSGASVEYGYDTFGNLTDVTLADGRRIDYLLDGRGRRVGKVVDGSLVWGLLYRDLINPVAMLDADSVVTARFVYGTKPHVPDYMIQGGSAYFLISDEIGSVRLVVDSASGSIAQRLDYDEFGRVALDTNPGFQPFGFAGGLYDYQTGLVHFGARDYDPGIGRWLTKDPIGFAGRDYNLYRYAYGDPINLIDVDGMNAGFLATGWGIALGEPTPIGEVVMGVATTGILLWGLWQAIDSDDDADKIKQSPPPEVAEPMENVDLPVSEPRGLDCPEAPFPGFDPTRPPGPDYEWKGSDQPGKGPGSWHNPKTGDSLNPDLDHPPPPGPHWDWKHKGEGGKPGYRISPDGTITPKG